MIDIVKFDDLFLKSKDIYHDGKEEWWEVYHRDRLHDKQPLILRILTDPAFQDDFTQLYQRESKYFSNKGFEVSPLSRDGNQLGYYRPVTGEVKPDWDEENYQPLALFFNTLKSRFVKGGRLTPEGQAFVISIWREARKLENLGLQHSQLTLNKTFVRKVKHVGYSFLFQDFPLHQDQPLLPLLDQMLTELMGKPYEKFLKYLKSQNH